MSGYMRRATSCVHFAHQHRHALALLAHTMARALKKLSVSDWKAAVSQASRRREQPVRECVCGVVLPAPPRTAAALTTWLLLAAHSSSRSSGSSPSPSPGALCLAWAWEGWGCEGCDCRPGCCCPACCCCWGCWAVGSVLLLPVPGSPSLRAQHVKSVPASGVVQVCGRSGRAVWLVGAGSALSTHPCLGR